MKILIVDDEPTARYGMAKALKNAQRQILEAEDGASALSIIRSDAPDLVFLDLNMPERNGMFVLQELKRDQSLVTPEIIVVTANDGVDIAVDCIRQGATDYITKPYDVEHIRSIARRSEQRWELQTRVRSMEQQNGAASQLGNIIGTSRPMQQLYRHIQKAALTDLPVLIRGESGTGKELVAQELHTRSKRSQKPFVAVNAAAIAESLIESELFGHVKGAFTGADRNREGVFRQADGGTLFLDEIGDMPSAVQTRLLRVIQEGLVQPVGTETAIKVDVRIISATHQDLEQSIADKVFRQDLYFRLKGIELFLPPLRSREEDILLLANRFVTEDRSFSPDAIQALLLHKWPGNVRELQQLISAAVALAEGNVLCAGDLGLASDDRNCELAIFEKYLDLPLTEARQQLTEDFEREAIRRALEQQEGNVSAAARHLGIHRQSLQQKMKALGICK